MKVSISQSIAVAGMAAAQSRFETAPSDESLARSGQGLAQDRSSAWAIRSRPASTFNAGLHGARGFLALLVFVFHISCSGVRSFPIQVDALPQAALLSLQFGVEIFFCISGFIVSGALRRAPSAVEFMVDRAIRILPVLWLTLAVIIPLGLMTHQSQFANMHLRDLAWIIPVNLVPLAGILPAPVLHMAAWSLSYELTFYALAALLWWLPAGQTPLRVVIGLLCTALIIWHPRAMFFGVGLLVSRTDLTRHPVLRQAVKAPGLVLLAFLGCWYVVQFGGGARGDATMLQWVRDGKLGVAAIAVSLAIFAFSGIVAGQGLLGLMLRSAPFQWLGALSYSFYLWHLIVIAIAKRGLTLMHIDRLTGSWSQVLLLLVCLPVSLAVSYASMRFVEQDLTGWIRAQRARRPLAISGPVLAAGI